MMAQRNLLRPQVLLLALIFNFLARLERLPSLLVLQNFRFMPLAAAAVVIVLRIQMLETQVVMRGRALL
jgi:hypothetical protein